MMLNNVKAGGEEMEECIGGAYKDVRRLCTQCLKDHYDVEFFLLQMRRNSSLSLMVGRNRLSPKRTIPEGSWRKAALRPCSRNTERLT